MLDKLSVPERPSNLDHGRARASALAVGAGGVVWTFFLTLISLLSPSMTRYRLKCTLKRP